MTINHNDHATKCHIIGAPHNPSKAAGGCGGAAHDSGAPTLVSPSGCSSDDSYIRQALKQHGSESGDRSPNYGEQNYPNPLDAASGFKTTIPFSTSAGGVATNRILDEKGVSVVTDDEEVLGSGKHFFYVTADKLPAGTYYYSIEFPQGVVIANKTMLVVK